jgi:hypothetical protein
MFRHRRRRPSPFADFIDWADYRWEPNAWQGPISPRRWTPTERRFNVVQVFLAGLAVFAVLKLMSALKNSAAALRNRGNRSWLEQGILAVLLLMVASYVSKRRWRL